MLNILRFVAGHRRIQGAEVYGLWLWGLNNYGQLGDETIVDKTTPVETVAGGTDWSQIACGYYHSGATKDDGTLWVWGRDTHGQLGDNTVVSKSSPIQTVAGGTDWSSISCGQFHTGAIKSDGTLWMWGDNNAGILGVSGDDRSSPIQTVAGGTDWVQVSAGTGHTAAIKTDGTLWSWGQNGKGQLGTGTTGPGSSSPVQTISGGTDWVHVSCGSFTTGAIKTDGTLWLWGDASDGQLGDNSTASKSSPVQTVAGGTNWSQIVCGYYHTLAIKTDGTLWSWGADWYGALGDNSTVSKSSPVQTISGGTDWAKAACGYSITAAIKTDGTLWTWGADWYGQLGDGGEMVHKSSPVQTVAGGTNWLEVAAGGQRVKAIAGI